MYDVTGFDHYLQQQLQPVSFNFLCNFVTICWSTNNYHITVSHGSAYAVV